MHDYLRLTIIIIILIIIIIITITIKITHVNFHLTSHLLLPYSSVINVDAKRLKTKLAAESNLILYRALSFIFEEVVGKLGASILNTNKRHRDRPKFLRTGNFCTPCLVLHQISSTNVDAEN